MVDTSTDGIDTMRARMARGRRVPPTPRTPGPPAGDAVPATAPAEPTSTPAATLRRPPRSRTVAAPVLRVPADAPPVNLAIRVRRPLDDHLTDVVHTLRRGGVRSSKVEVVEMLLWELAAAPGEVTERLKAFRAAAPRPSHAPIPD